MPDPREEVRRLREGCAELDAGVAEDEWASLETLLGYLYDDALRIPNDPAERDELIGCFVRLGWTVPAPEPES